MPTLLDPVERTNLNHWTTGQVREADNLTAICEHFI
jgi:hypothetical protein